LAILVIGGHSRSVGKTSVVAGLISALPARRWTAMKITQYGHGICSKNGQPCDCAVDDQEHSFAVTEERDRSGDSDTSRFLLAGAERSVWVRTRQGYLAEGMTRIRLELDRAGARGHDVILESNSIMRFLRPDLYLTVLDPANPDFKRSAREYLDRADALILDQPPCGSLPLAPLWDGISLRPVADRPIFQVRPPLYVTVEIVEFVRQKLAERVRESL
jgi:molybdopterin-guanine dinucleotide biosynthesis protein